MTPRQRSLMIACVSTFMAVVGLGLGVFALVGPDDDAASNNLVASAEAEPDGAVLGARSGDEAASTAGLDDGWADPDSDDGVPVGGVVVGQIPTPPVASASTTTTTVPATDQPATSSDGGGDEPSASAEVDPEPEEPAAPAPAPTDPEPSDPPPAETTSTVASTTTTERPAPSTPVGLTSIEREIYRLTNELRANPDGPLAREKAMPSCVNDSFYGITVDDDTGHPQTAPALTLNESVSLSLARPWAIEMDERDMFQHRSSSAALATYSQLGIGVTATGENIARSTGYPEAEAAMIHFVGWRESDDGHYCALVSPTYTHIGVGHHRRGTSSWAVQNFYRVR